MITWPVVVVSGASSGIGKACAQRLAERGSRVFGLSRRTPEGDGSIEHIATDVTQDDAVHAAIARVQARAGRIDMLVNCAGYGLAGAVADTTIAEARRQFEVNFFGTLRLCQAVIPAMRRQRAGLIINMSSLGGAFGLPFQGLYSASKFALEGLTEAMRHELGPFGVSVVAVEPGDVCTEITRNRVLAAASTAALPLDERFAAALAIMERDEARGIAPEQVADLVEKIWTSRTRHPKYLCGHPAQTIAAHAKHWLPAALFERLIADHYSGDKTAAARGEMGANRRVRKAP